MQNPKMEKTQPQNWASTLNLPAGRAWSCLAMFARPNHHTEKALPDKFRVRFERHFTPWRSQRRVGESCCCFPGVSTRSCCAHGPSTALSRKPEALQSNGYSSLAGATCCSVVIPSFRGLQACWIPLQGVSCPSRHCCAEFLGKNVVHYLTGIGFKTVSPYMYMWCF